MKEEFEIMREGKRVECGGVEKLCSAYLPVSNLSFNEKSFTILFYHETNNFHIFPLFYEATAAAAAATSQTYLGRLSRSFMNKNLIIYKHSAWWKVFRSGKESNLYFSKLVQVCRDFSSHFKKIYGFPRRRRLTRA